MSLEFLLLAAAALFGIGVYGALSQQSFVMIMMGLELMVNGAILTVVALWWSSSGGTPEGQMLAVVFMAVMAVEAAMGFALVINAYRIQKAEMTEQVGGLEG